MATEHSWMSREQRAKADFAGHVEQLRELVTAGPVEGGGDAVDALAAATMRFGTCELRMRTAERLSNTRPEVRSDPARLQKSALGYNDRGLALLPVVRAFADHLTDAAEEEAHPVDWGSAKPPLTVNAGLKQVRAELHDSISQLDVGGSDAEHLARMIDECMDSVEKDNLKGLSGYMGKQIDELEKQRNSPERGTQAASFPWWKLVAAAIWLGMTVYGVISALNRGARWWEVGMIILIALLGVILIALGC